ncbi:MAG: TetR/AcrR family transcriptional regulator [Chloroflexi bacterium]|nr:TetR/AcrR family transcriptional regulator [Chloroflexota bacterium]
MSHHPKLHTPPAAPRPGHPSSRPRERRDAAERRQRILAAAARLFMERGVEAVTMEEIARAAGVGKGTLYRRYSDKGQLCLAVIDACIRHFQDEVTAELSRADGATSALDQLDAFLGRLIAFVEAHTEWLGVVADQAAGERRGAFHCGPLYQWVHGVVARLLERAVATGEAAVEDCVYTADVLLATVDVDLYLFQRRERGYTPERIRAGLRRLVAGLRARPAPEGRERASP